MSKRNHPLSVCMCTHVGDGDHSDHYDTLGSGHGACRKCDCQQFSWERYMTQQEEQEYLTQSLIESLQRDKHRRGR